jgi:hypothetical protein
MPTILDLNLINREEVLSILNKVKRNEELCKEEIESIKTCINNSLVGTSKLLHFIAPENYAIWDSRIYRYITQSGSKYGINKVDYYQSYLSQIKKIANSDQYDQIGAHVTPFLNYKVSKIRVLDLVMFQADKRQENFLHYLFTKLPNNLGLRGNQYLWRDIQAQMLNKQVSSRDEFKFLIETSFEKLTGKRLVRGLEFEIKKYAHGGMSSGYIDSNWWLDDGIPYLLKLYDRIPH